MRLGAARMSAGRHLVEIEIADADLHPGAPARRARSGRSCLSAGDAAASRLIKVPAAGARSLCGRAWDWIELAS